jgi:two-component system response regulator PfeR
MNIMTLPPARLLVIEDDPVLAADLQRYFGDRHHRVALCHDGDAGLRQARDGDFDLVLLDILLPGLNGLELLGELRRVSPVPVILLSALGDEHDRVMGLRGGADDYLSKPFSMRELAVRVEAILRRVALERRAPAAEQCMGRFRLLAQRERASHDGRDLALTATEFRLLQVFLSQPDQVLSKAFLYQTVLHRGYGRHDRSLDLHVSHLRRKLRQGGVAGQPLRAVWGQGYVFVSEAG